MTCDWCAVNAGRTHAARPCCQIRRIAQAPYHQQEIIAARMTEDERRELRPRIKAEIERLRQLGASHRKKVKRIT